MAMVVKNNMSAVSTLNTLNKNSSALQKSLAKVSSGMKINSAQDDASGYAISEKMRVQIRSLDQANQNTQNASSMMKTAEGAVSSTVEILKSLKEKAINAATDTNTDSDRVTIQKELDQFIDQIDDNALTTFNGKYLVDGSKAQQGQATHTAMTNQSLATDTVGGSKLTEMKNRNNESLEIESTDYVTASFVKNGKTYTTKFSVEDTTLDQVFQNMNSQYQASGATDTAFAGAAAADSGDKVAAADSQELADVESAANALADKIQEEIDNGTVTGNAKNVAENWLAETYTTGADGKLTAVDPKTADYSGTTNGTSYADLAAGAGTTKQGGFDSLVTNVATEVGALGDAITAYNTALAGDSFTAKAAATVKAADGTTEITADNASTYTLDSGTLATLATTYNVTTDPTSDTYASDILKAAVGKMNDTISGEGGTVTFADDGSDLTAKKAAWAGDVNNSAGNTDSIDTDYANAEKLYNHIQASQFTSEEGGIINSVAQKTGKNSEDGAFAVKATTDTTLVGTNAAGDEVHTADGEPGLTVTSKEAGVTNQISGVTISITDSEGNVKKSANAALDQFKTTIYAKNKSADNELTFQVGAAANQSITVGLEDMRSEALGLKGSDGTKVSVATQDKANAAVAVFDNAIQKALDQQTTIGAVEARLEYTGNNLTTMSENVQSAESTIRDADMAKEMTAYTKNNVLLQAAQSMLAQANQSSSQVLSLLQ